MSLCLSFFTRPLDAEVLRNHAFYCQIYGYPHQVLDASHVTQPALRQSYKYSQILRHLRQLAQGDWLLFLDDDAVVQRPVAIDALMDGRDLLVVDGPFEGDVRGNTLTNMLVLRNTAHTRALLHQLIVDAGRLIAQETSWFDEHARFAPAGMLDINAVVADTYVNVSWRIANWHQARVFVLCLAPLPTRGADGTPKSPMLYDLNLKALLVRQANHALMTGGQALAPARYPALSDAPLSTHNPGGRIAFVSFYTDNVADYGRVSEHNVKRYCERHGYTYHVYRRLPEALAQSGMAASWSKPWLLREHFEHHDWVVWVDADVLFVNQTVRIESLMAGRDLLLAKDIGGWAVNSGVMGFKRTEGNGALLDALCQRIEQVQDKSSVYSSQGDQYYVNTVLAEAGLLGEGHVLDNVSINTPPHLATPQSLLVHFINLGEPYRSAYMADWDARSKALG